MFASALRLRVLGGACLLALTACSGGAAAAQADRSAPTSPTDPVALGAAPSLHVARNTLVDATGNTVVLHGVNRSGAEYVCHQHAAPGTVFDGPFDDRSVAAMTAWKGVTAVRVPLNEDCWLGLPGSDPVASGPVYQQFIKNYVQTLHRHGLVAILDLHWTDGFDKGPGIQCTDGTASCQKSMPDALHAPQFWTSVATVFKDDQATIFDLFNEPFPDFAHGYGKSQAWNCWQKGGAACPGYAFTVAGMQTLLSAVRSTGARNVVMLGGLGYSLWLDGWLSHKPKDPTGNLMASWHVYNFTGCITAACWNSNVAPVAKVVPVVVGEIGEDDCKHVFVDKLMPWLDQHHLSYLAWTWDAWPGCGPILIKDYDGTPTSFGVGIKNHYAKLAG